MNIARTIACVVLSSIPHIAGGQSRSLDSVDTFVRSEMARQKVPGVAIAIIRKGDVQLAQGYGLANVELRIPVGPETIFQSGSVGKQFTSTVVMLLVEQGKIGLEDPLTKFFPEELLRLAMRLKAAA